MDLQIGSTVGDYQVIGILGAGGMGKVYKVRNVISDRVEAMKVLLPDMANAPDLGDRFLREIKVQASLEHPNIAALHTAVRTANQLLMLMEFVEGSTLEQTLKEQGRLPVARAAEYISQVLAALEYAHARGVIHRDIKPGNMILTPAGVVKLMDFGIAKASSDHKLTMTGTTVGSLYYMSPEQIEGAVKLDPRSDLYSVGVSLYELVTGKRPFDGQSQFAIMSAHLQSAPVPPVIVDPTLPHAVNEVILLSVAKDPKARFQGAAAFRNALSRAVTAAAAPSALPIAPLAQSPSSLPPPAAPVRPRSRRGLWLALGGVAAAAVMIGVIELAPFRGTKAAPAAAGMPAPTPAQTAAPPSASLAVPVVRPSPEPVASEPPMPQQRPAAQPAAAAAPQAPPPVARPADLEKVRDDYDMLKARAAALLSHSLWRSPAASSDAANALSLMETYLGNAANALSAGDATSAKSYMEKAMHQIEALEKILN